MQVSEVVLHLDVDTEGLKRKAVNGSFRAFTTISQRCRDEKKIGDAGRHAEAGERLVLVLDVDKVVKIVVPVLGTHARQYCSAGPLYSCRSA